ncbi:MAG TPA: histidine phosphatase family protein [Anaerolineales bacterium]
MTDLILIRHGETDWNLEGRYTGQSDVPLNQRGVDQARRMAEELRGEPLAAIYSSDLARCARTAELLAEASGAPLHLDPRLREIDQGEWEGMLFEEIRTRFQEAWTRRQANPIQVSAPGGETVGQVQQRVRQALDGILAKHPAQTVAIVSHGLALAIIRVHLEQGAIQSVWDRIPPNAEPERVQVRMP